MDISETTLENYLKTKTTLFKKELPVQITFLTREADSYVDGYLNYLYVAKQEQQSVIIKHSKEKGASALAIGNMDPDRNYLEYMTYKLRAGFTPTMLPQVFFADEAEHVFIMEDLSSMEVMRFALNHGQQYPLLGRWIGEFLGKNHALTSTFQVTPAQFTNLDHYFENASMKRIVTDFILQPPLNQWDLPDSYAQSLLEILERIIAHPTIRTDWQKLVANFENKKECLIHGDFHTSNIFVDENGIKIIDMEYSMLAPFSYDLGYFLANLVSQFSAFHFNYDFAAEKRQQMTDYLLQMIRDVFDTYFSVFEQITQKKTTDFTNLFTTILQEAAGYLAMANICRTANAGSFPDFDCLQKREYWFMAKGLSLKICEDLLLQRKNFQKSSDLVSQIAKSTNFYLKDLQVFA